MGNRPSPLRKALRWNEPEKVRTILHYAGDDAPRLINEDYSQDCIMQSCTRAQGNALYYAVARNRVVSLPIMLEHGADVHSTGAFGETCLHCAARNCYVDTARLLIQHGADPRATDDQGHYPIHSAAMTIFDTTPMIKFLLEEVGKKEDVNSRDFSQRTPLHEAAYVGNYAVVQTLLSFGADINAVSREGNTPLHCAFRCKQVYDLLISHGADPTIQNQQGLTPNQVGSR